MNSINRQTGITFIGLCLVLGLIAFFALTAMKLFPLYNEKIQVVKAMESVTARPDVTKLSAAEMRKYFLRNLEVGDVDSLNEDNVKDLLKLNKIKGSKNKLLSLSYEIRGPLFGELDIILNFDKAIEIPGN